MFFVIRFAVEWIIWLLLADKKRWRELFPVAFFASLLGCLTDNVMHHYRLWEYDGRILADFTNDFGTYVVVTYLFIQWLPKGERLWNLFVYWVIWTSLAITYEWFHLKTNHIIYHSWGVFIFHILLIGFCSMYFINIIKYLSSRNFPNTSCN
jgi:hypothetical protein